MTSDSRRRANRRNAAKSTGPTSPSGKARVAQNGRKHGLNTPILADAAWAARPMQIAEELAEGGPITRTLVAYAVLLAELDRLRVTKEMTWRRMSTASEPPLGASEAFAEGLRQLKIYDGYERKLVSRLRAAADALAAEQAEQRQLAEQSHSPIARLADQTQASV